LTALTELHLAPAAAIPSAGAEGEGTLHPLNVTHHEVRVPANRVEATSTQLDILPGRDVSVTMTASGQITTATGIPPNGPEGRPGCTAPAGARAPGLPCGALVGRLGLAGPWFLVGAARSFAQPADLPPGAAGTLFLGVNDNTYGDNSGEFTVDILWPVVPARINLGGDGYQDSQGGWGTPDEGCSDGWVESSAARITGTADPALYQTLRVGLSTCRYPVPNGPYTVTLKFAELSYPSPGRRRFDVYAENQLRLANLDVELMGGYQGAWDYPFAVTVNDGALDLSFQHIFDNPTIAAIAIVPNGAFVPPTPTRTLTPSTTRTPTSTLTPTATRTPSPTLAPVRCADVDRSGQVDMVDFSLFRATFGLSTGAPGFLPRADIDGSGGVDIVDFSLLRAAFGTATTCGRA